MIRKERLVIFLKGISSKKKAASLWWLAAFFTTKFDLVFNYLQFLPQLFRQSYQIGYVQPML